MPFKIHFARVFVGFGSWNRGHMVHGVSEADLLVRLFFSAGITSESSGFRVFGFGFSVASVASVGSILLHRMSTSESRGCQPLRFESF